MTDTPVRPDWRKAYVPVTLGDVTVSVESRLIEDPSGVSPAGIMDGVNFGDAKRAIQSMANEFGDIWSSARPDEATLEFGLSFGGKTGALTSLLVEGSSEATLKVTLTWKHPARSQLD